MATTSRSTIAPGHLVAPRVPLVASIIAFSAGLVWSLGTLTARLADSSDAWQYLMWRSVGVLAVMEVYGRWIRPKNPRGSMTLRCFTGGWVMLLGTFGLLLASLGYVYAVKNTTAANAAFLSSITPLIAVVLSRVFLKERLNRVTIGALSVALFGLMITVSGDLQSGNMVGNISAMCCSVGFAIYTICVRTDPTRDWSPIMAGYAVAMIVLCGTVTASLGNTMTPPVGDIGLALLHGSVLIVLGTVLFNLGSRTVPAVAMTVLAQSEMAFAPFWVYLVLAETPSGRSLFGGAVILAAVIGKAVLDARPYRVLPNDDLLEAPPESGPAAV